MYNYHHNFLRPDIAQHIRAIVVTAVTAFYEEFTDEAGVETDVNVTQKTVTISGKVSRTYTWDELGFSEC